MKRKMRSHVIIKSKTRDMNGAMGLIGLFAIAVLLVLLFLGLILTSFLYHPSSTSGNATPPSGSATPSLSISPTVASSSPGQFISQELGIGFHYVYNVSGRHAYTKQIGNKVYLYIDDQEYSGTDESYLQSHGQYLEVFKKDPKDSLAQAITKQFLANISAKDCFVSPKTTLNLPPTYQAAIISYPGSGGAFNPASEKCPTPYTETNGLAYFLMDTAHPDKYVFFSIGQYLIMADDTTGWQNTIIFQ